MCRKCCQPWPKDAPRNRLGFAQWLTMPEQPLMPRVVTNRFWQEIFGLGIVETPDDFGIVGERPSNPDLLDWMAVDFRDSGGDVKRFFKEMVISATYRQSAKVTRNRTSAIRRIVLLARGPRFRMDGEMVRDTALEASGLLVEKIGGPPVKPYIPVSARRVITIRRTPEKACTAARYIRSGNAWLRCRTWTPSMRRRVRRPARAGSVPIRRCRPWW